VGGAVLDGAADAGNDGGDGALSSGGRYHDEACGRV